MVFAKTYNLNMSDILANIKYYQFVVYSAYNLDNLVHLRNINIHIKIYQLLLRRVKILYALGESETMEGIIRNCRNIFKPAFA